MTLCLALPTTPTIRPSPPSLAQRRVFLPSCTQTPVVDHNTHKPTHHRHRHHGRLRLLQPQPQCRPPRPGCATAQGHKHRNNHCGRALRWRRGDCSRHTSNQRAHSSRQGGQLPAASYSYTAPSTSWVFITCYSILTIYRTARSCTTSPPTSGAQAPEQLPTRSSPPPSSRRTSSCTPCPPAASRAL